MGGLAVPDESDQTGRSMNRGWRRGQYIVAAACSLVLELAACDREELVTVTLTEAELQERVGRAFPVTMTQLMARVTLDDPKVRLAEESERIAVDLQVTFALPLLAAHRGRVTVSGVPDYRRAERAIYFTQTRLERLSVPGLAPEQLVLAERAVEGVAQSVLATTPVYRLGAVADERVAQRVLTGMSVSRGELILKLGVPR